MQSKSSEAMETEPERSAGAEPHIRPGPRDDEATPESFFRDGRAASIFESILEALVRSDPAKAADLYHELVRSPDTEARRTAACTIDRLAAVERRVALTLWEMLLTDRDAETRELAYETLWMELERPPGEQLVALSAYEAGVLARAHHDATVEHDPK